VRLLDRHRALLKVLASESVENANDGEEGQCPNFSPPELLTTMARRAQSHTWQYNAIVKFFVILRGFVAL
jgi:hypothetical protein